MSEREKKKRFNGLLRAILCATPADMKLSASASRAAAGDATEAILFQTKRVSYLGWLVDGDQHSVALFSFLRVYRIVLFCFLNNLCSQLFSMECLGLL